MQGLEASPFPHRTGGARRGGEVQNAHDGSRSCWRVWVPSRQGSCSFDDYCFTWFLLPYGLSPFAEESMSQLFDEACFIRVAAIIAARPCISSHPKPFPIRESPAKDILSILTMMEVPFACRLDYIFTSQVKIGNQTCFSIGSRTHWTAPWNSPQLHCLFSCRPSLNNDTTEIDA